MVAASVALAGGASAAPVVPSTGQALSREQVNPAQQIPQPRRRTPDVLLAPVKEACELSNGPAVAFDFKQAVVADDARVLPDREKQAAWSDLVGKRITPSQICDIRDRLADRIFRNGVLAWVVIPPQTIRDGTVRLQIIAAKIVAVRFDGDDIGPTQGLAEAYLDHLRHQNTFDLATAQKWLLLVNDMPGILAVARLVHSTAPGAPVGGLDLVVTLRRLAMDESVLVANTNAQTLGPWTGLARVDFNSFTPLGERTSLIAYSTLGNFRQDVAQVQESVRLGDSGLFGLASFAYGHSRPGNVLEPLDLTGDSFTGSFEVDYPVMRLQERSLFLASGMDFVNQRTALPTGQAVSDDALRVAWIRADGALAASDRPWGAELVSTAADLSLQLRKGLDVLGASVEGAPDLSRVGGQADALVLRGEGHVSWRVAPMDAKWPPVTVTVHYLGQWADRALLAYEQQAIGNLTIGRGYDPSAAAGDDVVAGEVKVELGPFGAGRGGKIRLSPYVFDDTAYVAYIGPGSPAVTLRSLGGGFEVRLPYDSRGNLVRLDIGYAQPLDRPTPGIGKKPPGRLLVELIVNH